MWSSGLFGVDGGERRGEEGKGEGRGASPLMRGTSSRAQAHFLFLKVNRRPAGVRGVMGKEETVMLIRPAHTSPSNNITKQEWKHGKPADNCGGTGCIVALVLYLNSHSMM